MNNLCAARKIIRTVKHKNDFKAFNHVMRTDVMDIPVTVPLVLQQKVYKFGLSHQFEVGVYCFKIIIYIKIFIGITNEGKLSILKRC